MNIGDIVSTPKGNGELVAIDATQEAATVKIFDGDVETFHVSAMTFVGAGDSLTLSL